MRLSIHLPILAATLMISMAPSTVIAKEESGLRRQSKNGDQDVRKGQIPVKVDPFMSALESISDQEKLFLAATMLHEVIDHVDWEKLRDEYLTTIYTSEARRRRLEVEPHMTDIQEVKSELENEVNQAIEEAFPKSPSIRLTPTNQSGNSFTAASIMESEVPEVKIEHSKQGKAIGTNIELSFEVVTSHTVASKVMSSPKNHGQAHTDDGIAIPEYVYDTGNCPGAGNSNAAVPCAPDNLDQICDKYNADNQGKFSLCFAACQPSFCCIHDAPPDTNFVAPNCNTDVNCAAYACCYIVWWKLHDTIGPATQLRLEQNDDFFDVAADFIVGDVTNVAFYREMLFHHFNDANEIIRLGTKQVNSSLSVFDSDLIFLNSTYWNTTI